MDKNHKITIPEPCHENWDKMIPKDNGRFCLSCNKTVIDFTKMHSEEIQHFFIQNQNDKICGRFKKSQLDTITIQIPTQVLYSQTNYYKMFLLALFIAMGTTLFSCADKEGNKKKIDKVEVVKEETIKEETDRHTSLGMPLPEKDSSNNATQPKIDKKSKNSLKTNKKAVCSPESSSKSTKAQTPKEEPVYNGGVAIETNAEFPGGIEQFYNFFAKEFKKPESVAISKLKINLSFAVEKNGSASYLQSVPEIDNAIKEEIIRVLNSCPKWQPGEINGKKVRRMYSLPLVLQ